MARRRRGAIAARSKQAAVSEVPTPKDQPVLGSVIGEKQQRISEYKRRKPRVLQKRVSPGDVEARVAEGWTVRRILSAEKTLIEKQKTHDEILENRFWSVLYQFGFEELSSGRAFQIQVTFEGHPVRKQIDVFGRIGDVVFIAECKSCLRKQPRSLQKDIGEFASYQRPISNALRKHYGTDRKLKVVWLFVTSNVIWSTSDRARAEAQNIQIVEERELRYFEEIAKNVGSAAAYQFLAEFLSNQKIPELADYSVPAIRTKLGGNWAYYFLAPPDRILPIAFVNHRGLRDIQGAPAYQRVLKRSRIKEIGGYLDAGGFFPNCILINFREDVRFEKQSSFEDRQITFGNLFLPDRFKSAWIIDGQHRLFGFTEAEKQAKHVLPVLAFEKLSTVSEAELFATINSKQQKVARGLIDCYVTVKADPDGVWRYLREFKRDHSDKFYYEVRNAAFRSPAKTAAQFIYLNRTCFNGIYRENLRGVFNVPRGTKDSVILPDDDFKAISKLLKPVQLLSGDFAGSLQAAKKGDFVFVDPPYTVRHNSNGFVKYNQKIFDWKDQIRLRDEVKAAASRGAKLLITNANHPSIVELYEGIGSAAALNRASVISGDSTSRGRYSELVITIGYEPKEPAVSRVPGSSERR